MGIDCNRDKWNPYFKSWQELTDTFSFFICVIKCSVFRVISFLVISLVLSKSRKRFSKQQAEWMLDGYWVLMKFLLSAKVAAIVSVGRGNLFPTKATSTSILRVTTTMFYGVSNTEGWSETMRDRTDGRSSIKGEPLSKRKKHNTEVRNFKYGPQLWFLSRCLLRASHTCRQGV